jgi:predicted dehydrogenase
MYKVKIVGAGSIGNHLAHASRSLGWHVVLCDIDEAALERTKTKTYPDRYGQWDEAIGLYHAKEAPKSGYDLIVIGTPPDSHLPLAIEALEEKPRAILVEKPLCKPNLERAQEFNNLAAEWKVPVFMGYDHVVGQAAEVAMDAARQLTNVETLDVEFREHWGGIFKAHPWLAGPQDSYLGFWQRGGGASGEHSHALNLWQFFARGIGAGRVTEVSAILNYIRTSETDYDNICLVNLKTEAGLIGRVVQDVVTSPPRKWARIQGGDGFVDLTVGLKPGTDGVHWKIGNAEQQTKLIEKTRPDDFIQELNHIRAVLEGQDSRDILFMERGLETMLVVSAAHLSAEKKRSIRIDYEAGWSTNALRVI